MNRNFNIFKLTNNVIFLLFLSIFYALPTLATGGDGGGDPGMPCEEALPFCSDENYNFPNVSNNTVAPDGPNYGCLSSQPNPVWYYMEIAESGQIQLNLAQSTGPNGSGIGLDVDFAMWGPFTDVGSGCSQINSGSLSPLQCSYSPSETETLGIGLPGGSGSGASTPASAQAGQIYIVVITNYDEGNGYITFNQTNFGQPGAGSTDCSIVDPCAITNFTHTVSNCENDLYSVSGSVSFTDAPETGTLIVEDCNGNQAVVATAPFTQSSYTYTLSNLVANGSPCSIEVYFSDTPCSETFEFTAPAACSCEQPSLIISAINECGPGSVDLNSAIGSGSDNANLSFYSSSANANAGTNAISNLVGNSGSYWVRAEAIGDTSCFSVYEIQVVITTVSYTLLETHPSCGEANGSIEINGNGGTSPYSFSMNVGGVAIQNSTGVFENLMAGSYSFIILDANGCQATGTTTLSDIGSEENPAFDFEDFCFGATNGPSNIATPGGIFDLFPIPTDGASINSSTGVITGGVGGANYTVIYTVGDDCPNTYSQQVNVLQGPTADFIASPMVVTTENPEVTFNNNSLNATDYTWDFGDESPLDYSVNTTHTFPNDKEGTYVVTLIASDGDESCNDTLRMVIFVEEELIFYVPNAFTPDNDTYNEELRPVFSTGFDPYNYTFEVYNRWGEVLFESHDVNVGWDGTYGGKIVKDGTYIWKIKVKENGKDKHNEYVGHVTLLK